MLPPDDQALLDKVLAAGGEGQRRAVAKAITLLESSRADHRARADDFLTALPAPARDAFRLGVSGVPGVGKSSFIETLGLQLIARGHRVAVLAVDPSSSLSGGSILGDKTRMEKLSVERAAFVRPSPSGGTLGGVAAATREAIRVVEAAGYDIVIVETVGVGQSEAAVAGMTDMFLLLQLPNAGDDLQAIKKGVMELADLVVVNKADLDLDAARRAVAHIESALRLVARRDERGLVPQVLATCALAPDKVAEVWRAIERFRDAQQQSGALQQRRRHQAEAWLWERIDAGLRASFRCDPSVRAQLDDTLAAVESGRLPVSVAARRLLAAFGAVRPPSVAAPT
jgi:LAO/AO transport system kinase